MKRKSFFNFIVLISVLTSALLCGCSAKLEFVRREGDYSKFLSQLEIYPVPDKPSKPDIPENPDNPGEEFSYPEIIGFAPLYYTDFDYASGFCGEYAFVKKDGHHSIVSKNGDVKEAAEDLQGKNLVYDKYVFSDGEYSGVKTIFGETLINAEYSDIQIFGNTVAAMRKDGTTDIFSGKNKIGFYNGKVELASEDFLFADHRLYKTDMSVMYCGDYRMVFPPVNGIGVIDGGELFGYGDISGNILIEPKYPAFSDFYCGFATVVSVDGCNCVIDESGNEIIRSDDENIKFFSFDGTYLIYSVYGAIHIADKNIKDLTDRVFEDIADVGVCNGFVIVYDGTRVYSVTENAFVSEIFVSVYEKNGIFIAQKDNGKTAIYNENFEAISDDLDLVLYENDVLTVKNGEKYYFYTAE